MENIDHPPPYSEVASNPYMEHRLPCSADSLSADKLRRFVAFRLAVDYDLMTLLPKSETPSPKDYYQLLNYAMLIKGTETNRIGMQRMLNHHLTEPAQQLGIPQDIVEFSLVFLRESIKHYGEYIPAFAEDLIIKLPTLHLTKLALDYDTVISAVTRDMAFACALRDKCIKIHMRYYPFMLSLENVGYEQPGEGSFNYRPTMTVLPNFDDLRGWKALEYWPNVQHIVGEANRPSLHSVDSAVSSQYTVVDITGFAAWVKNKESPTFKIIPRSPRMSQRTGTPPILWLPEFGWWENPDTAIDKASTIEEPPTSNSAFASTVSSSRPNLSLPLSTNLSSALLSRSSSKATPKPGRDRCACCIC